MELYYTSCTLYISHGMAMSPFSVIHDVMDQIMWNANLKSCYCILSSCFIYVKISYMPRLLDFSIHAQGSVLMHQKQRCILKKKILPYFPRNVFSKGV